MRDEPKTLPLKLPFFGYSRLCLGRDIEIVEEKISKHTIFFRLLSDEPQNPGEEIKILTFGIFFLAGGSGMRLGFVKRHQILARA